MVVGVVGVGDEVFLLVHLLELLDRGLGSCGGWVAWHVYGGISPGPGGLAQAHFDIEMGAAGLQGIARYAGRWQRPPTFFKVE